MHYVEMGEGCHGRPVSPIIYENLSWADAQRLARRSDRLVAVNATTGERFQIPEQGHPRYGPGRYGRGLR